MKIQCMSNYIKFIIVAPIAFVLSLAKSQTLTLEGEIFEYATYYISSFDFNTGGTNVQIFRYELSSDQYPTTLKVRFTSSMISPALGINNEQVIISIETDPFEIQAPLILDNRDISAETTTIFDQGTPPNPIELNGEVIEFLDPLQAEAIMQSIFATGQIADGEYTFEIVILSENNQLLASDSRTFLVESPISVTLESPGGALSDTLENIVYSSFPFDLFTRLCILTPHSIKFSLFDNTSSSIG